MLLRVTSIFSIGSETGVRTKNVSVDLSGLRPEKPSKRAAAQLFGVHDWLNRVALDRMSASRDNDSKRGKLPAAVADCEVVHHGAIDFLHISVHDFKFYYQEVQR